MKHDWAIVVGFLALLDCITRVLMCTDNCIFSAGPYHVTPALTQCPVRLHGAGGFFFPKQQTSSTILEAPCIKLSG